MGNDQAGTMRRIINALLLILLLNTGLSAASCREYEASYSIAQYKMDAQLRHTYREKYDLVNSLIDSAYSYLAYCTEEIALGEQYQIRQVIKRADKKRQEYFIGAVREYHALYGIAPNVTEIYQNDSYPGSGGGTSTPSTPPRFPTVPQPMMPPVQN